MTSMRQSHRRFTSLRQILSHVILHIGVILIFIPFGFMVSTSLKYPSEIYAYPPKLIPSRIDWQNYPEAIDLLPVSGWIFAKNSVVLSLTVTIGQVLSSACVAFGFARIRFRGSDILFFILLSTMMLPSQITMIPLFILFSRLGWVNTYLPLVIPAYFGSAYYIFFLRQFFATIPDDLDDAAKIDGCSFFGIFLRLALPMSKAALGITAILSFTGMWNSFLQPLIYINELEKYPLALALRAFQSRPEAGYATWEHIMVMGIITSVVPVALFFVAQRYYIQGIVITGVKG